MLIAGAIQRTLSEGGIAALALGRPGIDLLQPAEAIAGWQIKRDGTRRGIVELISEAP